MAVIITFSPTLNGVCRSTPRGKHSETDRGELGRAQTNDQPYIYIYIYIYIYVTRMYIQFLCIAGSLPHGEGSSWRTPLAKRVSSSW